MSKIESLESQMDDQRSFNERIAELEKSLSLAVKLDEHDESIKKLDQLWKDTLP